MTTTTSPASLVTLISSTLDSGITLGQNGYGTQLTVTSTGGVPSIYGNDLYGDAVTNAGTVSGIQLLYQGSVTNTGTLTGYVTITEGSITNSGVVDGLITLADGDITNMGLISGGSIGVNDLDGVFLNSGKITASSEAVSIGLTTLINTGVIESPLTALTIGGEGTLINEGTVIGAVIGSSLAGGMTVIDTPGAVFDGTVNGMDSGTLVLAAGDVGSQHNSGSLDMGSSFTSFQTIDFASGSTWTLEGSIAELAAGQTISGFVAGDTIVIDDFNFTGLSHVTGEGLVLQSLGSAITLDITGNVKAISASERGADTVITTGAAPCFCRGTRIATARGNVPVERLRIGDLVRTAHNGFRPISWIGTRSYDGRFIAGNHLALPVRIRRHALGFNIPSRDLFISPDHAICEGGVLIHAWRLVNGVSITQAQSVGLVEYFHIELDSHDIVFAHNTPVESFLDAGCRERFHTGIGTPGAGVEACRPRVEEGYYLAQIKARIDGRAGIPPVTALGALRGCLDETSPRLRGWAQDVNAPETPVELEVLYNGHIVMRFLANAYREDLRRAGLGSGSHAFDMALTLPSGAITIHRRADGFELASARVRAA